MAKDFALLAEAYKSIYEAGEVTGVVAAPAVGAPTQPIASTSAQTQQAGSPAPIKLQAKDSTKLIKNLNDIYLKTRENADILTRNNVPGAKEQFNTQKTLMGQTIASIISLTIDGTNPNVYKGLSGGLDKDLLPFVQQQTTATTPIKAAVKQ